MSDFLAALGLVFVIEGLVFAAFPGAAKRAVAAMIETPDPGLRTIGLASAVFGLAVLWLVRMMDPRARALCLSRPCHRNVNGHNKMPALLQPIEVGPTSRHSAGI